MQRMTVASNKTPVYTQLKAVALDFATKVPAEDKLALAKQVFAWLAEEHVKEEEERIRKRDERLRGQDAEQGELFD